MKAILLISQDGDWEGLFIDGKLISEGHQLGEGRKEFFWLNIGAEYGIKGDDLVVKEVNEKDDEELSRNGGFPSRISMLDGSYT